ncbi:MAG: ester cyclase [SAR202 cluster bacterium]|nr:ester cyclase [SAR202 cluster bacterium]
MTPTEMQQVLHRVHDEVIDQGKLHLVEELYQPTVVWHGPGAEYRGWAGMKELYGSFAPAFPERTYDYEFMRFTEDSIVGRWVLRGVHRGAIMGVAPTGRRITVTGITVHRFEDGRIAEEWEEFDALGLLRQLGALPRGLGL